MPTRTLVAASAAAGAAPSARTAMIGSVFSRRIRFATGEGGEGCALRGSSQMRAAVFTAPGRPLEVVEHPEPSAPGPGEILLDVGACGVCRTDLHLLDGEVDVPRP